MARKVKAAAKKATEGATEKKEDEPIDDEEMKEMLEMLEAAKGDLEVVKEDDLMEMMDNIDDDNVFAKAVSTVPQKRKQKVPPIDSTGPSSQKRKQQVTELSTDELIELSKKKRANKSASQVAAATQVVCDISVETTELKGDAATKQCESIGGPCDKNPNTLVNKISNTAVTVAASKGEKGKKVKVTPPTKKQPPKGGVALFGVRVVEHRTGSIS